MRRKDENQNPVPAAEAAEDLTAQLAAAQTEISELNAKYLLAVADLDNYRKVQDRRIADRIKQEKKTVFLRLIEVIDNLDRALAHQDIADRETLLSSLRLMYQQLNAVLQREGITSFTSQGESFSPHLHEAVESVDNSGQPEGHVVQEMQKGYRYGDELLRPARVHVSSGKDQG